MAELRNSGASESSNGRRETRWSEEYDRLPLKQRMKLLLAQNRLSEMLPQVNSEAGENSNPSAVANHVVVKKEDDDSESLCPVSFAEEEKISNLSSHQSRTVELEDQITEAKQTINATATEEKVNVIGTGSFQQCLLSKNAVSLKDKCSEKSPSGLSRNCQNSSSGVDLAAVQVKTESPVNIFDDDDLVPLKERQRRLLSSQKMGLINSSTEGNSMRFSSFVYNMNQKDHKGFKEKCHYGSKEFPVARSQLAENQKNLNSSSKAPRQGSNLPLEHPTWQNRSTNAGNITIIKDKNMAGSFRKKISGSEADVGKCPLSSNTTMLNVAVKIEPVDENETIGDKTLAACLPSDDVVLVKHEHDMADDFDTDQLDHMTLSKRMKLFSELAKVPSFEIKGSESCSRVVPSGLHVPPFAPEAVKRRRDDRPRKRRKTATDSVQTALEEDAPDLLQVLIDQGVSVDEIKLYGQMESDEALEQSNDDNFTELESVMVKIFSQRTSLSKLAPSRYTRGEKASYFVACLFSLVEQARYLQFRKWPVEWGWSRDLQSFIFVFQRHNRIVLERPEYGYATYFFELVNSLPIDWQIKRLVIAMKLTSCGRVTLIENKTLEVGEDLSEGEAKVLMQYGWIPNTGLGTMLHYCDRVVHDRKNEKDTSEWRSKIGKLLVDGYNGGSIVSTDPPKKALEYNFAQCPEIK